jgi:hypothetical protein
MAEQQHKKKKNVKGNDVSLSTLGLKDEQGFTYIEMVISLTILIAIIPTLFFVGNTYHDELKHLSGQYRLQKEYIHWMLFVQNELKQGSAFHNEGTALVFDLPSGDAIRYEWKDRQVLRSVKKKGTSSFQGRTILAYHVDKIAFVPSGNGVHLDICLQNRDARFALRTTIMARGQ